MTKFILCFILGGFMIICFSQDVTINNPVALLQRYRAAEQIYQQAEKISPQTEGMQARAGQLYREALSAFQQLIVPAQQMSYDSLVFCLYFRTGDIYYKQENSDSALIFYKKAEEVNNSYAYLLNEKQQYYSQLSSVNVPHGLLFKNKADQLAEAGRYYEAIQQYQEAIMQFDTSFTNPDIYKNPEQFVTLTSFTYLFNTLAAKAEAFEHLRPDKKNIKALSSAVSAYRSALLLVEFMKKNNGSNGNDLLLDDIKNTIQNRPIKVNMELFELTEQKTYLEDAYLFDQRMKLLSLSQDTGTAPGQKRAIPAVASLQQLIDKRTAILSYYLSANELSTFIITRTDFGYHTEALQQGFLINVDSFRLSLYNSRSQENYNPALAGSLYEILISPIHDKLKGIKRLIIIPGDDLNYLPFEALQNMNEKYLLEEFSVQYHYSTALLGRQTQRSAEPSRSFTISYPGNSNDINSYTEDIHHLDLDSTQLVILNMTDRENQLIKSNGVMDLSEAFTDAGCPNMITSLWKSEDEVTVFVTKKLHEYLDEGYSRDKALQKARLDLLRSDDIDSRFKTPVYWANMVLIGEYEPPYTPTPWILISIIASIVAALVWVITVKSNY